MCNINSQTNFLYFFIKTQDKSDFLCYNYTNVIFISERECAEYMTFEKSCGAIVYRKHHGNTEILLIKHINSGHWSFPKGHMEQGESETETALREIKEETGLDVLLDPTFRESVTYFPRKDTQKVVVYFIAKAKTYDYTPQEDEIAEIRWVDIGYAATMLTYENDKTIVNKARTAICL